MVALVCESTQDLNYVRMLEMVEDRQVAQFCLVVFLMRCKWDELLPYTLSNVENKG